MHDETYRMLGREHEADLERERAKWRLAAEARRGRHAPAAIGDEDRRARSRRFTLSFWVRLIPPSRQADVR